MFIPVGLLVLVLVLLTGLALWSYLLASGRNPLPFPDPGSRIFATPSLEAKNAIVALLAGTSSKNRPRYRRVPEA